MLREVQSHGRVVDQERWVVVSAFDITTGCSTGHEDAFTVAS